MKTAVCLFVMLAVAGECSCSACAVSPTNHRQHAAEQLPTLRHPFPLGARTFTTSISVSALCRMQLRSCDPTMPHGMP
jgi:hypothetical protein